MTVENDKTKYKIQISKFKTTSKKSFCNLIAATFFCQL